MRRLAVIPYDDQRGRSFCGFSYKHVSMWLDQYLGICLFHEIQGLNVILIILYITANQHQKLEYLAIDLDFQTKP